MKSASLLVLVVGAAASAQPSSLPAPIPSAEVPSGMDSRGNPYLAPGPFPATLNANYINVVTRPGGVMDGAGSNYLRFGSAPLGGPFLMSGNDANEGDLDVNISPNADLIADYFDDGFGNWSDPRTPWVFPTADPWDTFEPDRLNRVEGEASYGWAPTIGAGTAFLYIPENGRDNMFTDFGLPTGTLYSIGQASPNDFRGGFGYNMLTGQYGNGNGSIFFSFCAVGLPTEYINDASIVWFPYVEGWTTGAIGGGFPAAWSERTTAPDPMTGVDVVWPSRSSVLPEDASEVIVLDDNGFAQGTIEFDGTDLGHSPENAMLFVQGGNGNNNLNNYNILESGDSWRFLARKDDGIDTSGTDTAEFTPVGSGDMSFVVLPYDTPNLLGGSYAADGSAIREAGGNANLTLTRTGVGMYEVTIPGASGQDGMFMMQPTGAAAGDAALPGRNFMNYEYNAGSNTYTVYSREVILGAPGNIYGEEYPLVDSPFYLAYISFSASPTGPGLGGGCSPADLAEPFGIVDIDDVDAFIDAFLTGDSAADFVAPFGIVDIDDVDEFIVLFLAGCP